MSYEKWNYPVDPNLRAVDAYQDAVEVKVDEVRAVQVDITLTLG